MRPAEATDVALLVQLYTRAYEDGYSACFDRYGPIGPQEFWWVLAEKSVELIEVNRQPVGMIILGRQDGRLLIEELLGRPPVLPRGDVRPDPGDGFLLRIHDFLLDRFQRARQDWMRLRASETNPLALAFARRFDFTFANALVVVAATAKIPQRNPPVGYTLRRATADDVGALGQLHQECFHSELHPEDLKAAMRRSHTKARIAEREGYAVGFSMLETRDGFGRGVVGVREAHRQKGLGTALALEVLQFVREELVIIGTYWALDAAASAFCQRLRCTTERTYLYFEKRL
jgi:N-acetylglutamate synthase-like GNAT family acetyltransferase